MPTIEFHETTGTPVAVWHDTETGRGDTVLAETGGVVALRTEVVEELAEDIERCGLGPEAILVAESREDQFTTVRAAARCTRPGCIAQVTAWEESHALDVRHHLAGGEPHAEATAALVLRAAVEEAEQILARAGLTRDGAAYGLADAEVPPEAWAHRTGSLSAALRHLVEQVERYAAPLPQIHES